MKTCRSSKKDFKEISKKQSTHAHSFITSSDLQLLASNVPLDTNFSPLRLIFFFQIVMPFLNFGDIVALLKGK